MLGAPETINAPQINHETLLILCSAPRLGRQ